MAKIIEFRPRILLTRPVKWVPSNERGKLIEFPKRLKPAASGSINRLKAFLDRGNVAGQR